MKSLISFIAKNYTRKGVKSYQDTVEELVYKQTQHANDDVTDMQKEEDVHDNCFVPSCERALVPHKTNQEHHFIQQLWKHIRR